MSAVFRTAWVTPTGTGGVPAARGDGPIWALSSMSRFSWSVNRSPYPPPTWSSGPGPVSGTMPWASSLRAASSTSAGVATAKLESAESHPVGAW